MNRCVVYSNRSEYSASEGCVDIFFSVARVYYSWNGMSLTVKSLKNGATTRWNMFYYPWILIQMTSKLLTSLENRYKRVDLLCKHVAPFSPFNAKQKRLLGNAKAVLYSNVYLILSNFLMFPCIEIWFWTWALFQWGRQKFAVSLRIWCVCVCVCFWDTWFCNRIFLTFELIASGPSSFSLYAQKPWCAFFRFVFVAHKTHSVSL